MARCMAHSIGLGTMCTELCQLASGEGGGGRGLPAKGLSGKKPTRGGRVGGHTQGCKGTVLNREVVNPV